MWPWKDKKIKKRQRTNESTANIYQAGLYLLNGFRNSSFLEKSSKEFVLCCFELWHMLDSLPKPSLELACLGFGPNSALPYRSRAGHFLNSGFWNPVYKMEKATSLFPYFLDDMLMMAKWKYFSIWSSGGNVASSSSIYELCDPGQKLISLNFRVLVYKMQILPHKPLVSLKYNVYVKMLLGRMKCHINGK